MTELRLGSHVSMRGDEMLIGSVEQAIAYKETAFMIYTGAPQNTKRKPIDDLHIPAAHALMKQHDMRPDDIIVHAPYIINLANTIKPRVAELAISFLRSEIQRAEAIGAKQMVLHPGSHVGEGVEAGIKAIIDGLNEVLTPDQTIQIALETMAGKGSELGKSFEELAQIIDGVKHADKLSVCFDTCHVWDAGYDIVHNYDAVIKQFSDTIGLDRLSVLHINDSKNSCGSHKDRHENIGFGEIGFDTLNRVVHDHQFGDICRILETPYISVSDKEKAPPYKFEIAMLRAQQFDANLKQEVIQDYEHANSK